MSDNEMGTSNGHFPGGGDDLAAMFGVTDEDREAWDKSRAAYQRRKSQRSGLLNNAVKSIIGVVETGITSQMRAAYIEEQRGTIAKETTTKERTVSRNVDPELEEMDPPVDTSGYEL